MSIPSVPCALRRVASLLLAATLLLGGIRPLGMNAVALGFSPYGYSAAGRGAGEYGHFGDQLSSGEQALYGWLLANLTPKAGLLTAPYLLDPPFTLRDHVWNNDDEDVRRDQLTNLYIAAYEAVLPALHEDHPEIFWLSMKNSNFYVEGYTPSGADVLLSAINFKSVLNGGTAAMQNTMNGNIAALLDTAPASGGYEQVAWALDTVLRLGQPAAGETILRMGEACSILANGAGVVGTATPAGYARAFQLLCQRQGIDCVVVAGTADLGDGAQDHHWNLVHLDGGWYAVDTYRGETDRGVFLAGANTVCGDTTFADTYRPDSLPSPLAYPGQEAEAYTPVVPPEYLPDVAVSANGSLVYGQPLGDLELTGSFRLNDGTPVRGLLEWVEPDALPGVGALPQAYSFTPLERYAPTYGKAAVTVAPRPLTITPVTGRSVYNDPAAPAIPYLHDDLVEGNAATTTVFSGALALDGKDAGTHSILPGTLSAGTNYTLTVLPDILWDIAPRPLTLTDVRIAPKQYDGDSAAQVSGITAPGLAVGDDVTVDLTATFDQTDSGTHLPVTVEVHGLLGRSAANYTLTTPPLYAEVFGDILPYTGGVFSPDRLYVYKMWAGSTTSLKLGEKGRLLGPGQSGTLSYHSLGYDPSAFLLGCVLGEDGVLSCTLDNPLTAGDTTAVEFTARSRNYADAAVSLLLEVTDKMPVTVVADSIRVSAVYGSPAITVEPVGKNILFLFEEQTVKSILPAFSYGRGEERHAIVDGRSVAPASAGSHTLWVDVPKDNPTYIGGDRLEFTVDKAALTVTPDSKTVRVGDPLPALTLHCEGLVVGDTLAAECPETIAQVAVADTSRPGRYPISVAGPSAYANYTITRGTGWLDVVAETPGIPEYDAPDANPNGWHNRDIVITPSGAGSYDEIAVGSATAFGSRVVLSNETASGAAKLYFRKGELVSEPVDYTYRLDKSPPVISRADYVQTFDKAAGTLVVAASDGLSGVDATAVDGPDGAPLDGEGGVFPVDGDGSYTVSVTDAAGNRTSLQSAVLIRRVDGVHITDTAGTVLGDTTLSVDLGGGKLDLVAATSGTALHGDFAFTWSSSDPLVAAVDETGLLSPLSEGITRITVSAMGKTAGVTVEVHDAAVTPPDGSGGGGTGSSGGGSGRNSGTSTRDSDINTEAVFWATALSQVKAAKSGSAVRVVVTRYESVPAELLWAIQGRPVTLVIDREGDDDIVLYGKDVPVLDKSVHSYTMAMLLALQPSGSGEQGVTAPRPVYVPGKEDVTVRLADDIPAPADLPADGPLAAPIEKVPSDEDHAGVVVETLADDPEVPTALEQDTPNRERPLTGTVLLVTAAVAVTAAAILAALKPSLLARLLRR